MKAFLLSKSSDLSIEQNPLTFSEQSIPEIKEHEILIKVRCCGVCHTELDEIEGRTPPSVYPMIPGHQVVGVIEKMGEDVNKFKIGDRVGVAWIFSSCGICEYCRNGFENLCSSFKATGRDANGGYAEFMAVDSRFAFHIPAFFSDEQAAPLLCAGAIGYRSLKLTNLKGGEPLGLCGFGGSGHQVLKMAKSVYPDSPIFVFARSAAERAFAQSLGAAWAGDIGEKPPTLLQAIIETTPAWNPVIQSLSNLKPGGRLVINAIRKEAKDIASFLSLDYSVHLWMEKEIKSVANITRTDVSEFLELAARIPLVPEIQIYAFEDANRALWELKNLPIKGSKVLVMK